MSLWKEQKSPPWKGVIDLQCQSYDTKKSKRGKLSYSGTTWISTQQQFHQTSLSAARSRLKQVNPSAAAAAASPCGKNDSFVVGEWNPTNLVKLMYSQEHITTVESSDNNKTSSSPGGLPAQIQVWPLVQKLYFRFYKCVLEQTVLEPSLMALGGVTFKGVIILSRG